MKPVLTILLFFIFIFSAHGNQKVVATTTFLADIARNIAREKLEIICMMPTGGDPHIYDPTPGDAQKIVESNLVIKNGLFLEGWLEELINNAGGQRPIIEAAEGVDSIASQVFHGSPDPHAWMDALNGIVYASNIKNAFIQLDAVNADYYNKNFDEYKKKLLELNEYIQIKINEIEEIKRVLITSHDAFSYFGKRYGMKVESALGTSTDADVQIGDINKLINVIKETGVDAVFVESTINPKLMEQLAADHGISIGGKLYADSLGDEFSGADTYLKMLKHNADVISGALKNKKHLHKSEESLLPLLTSVLALFICSFFWLLKRIRTSSNGISEWKNFTINIQGLSVSYHRKTVLSTIYLELFSGQLYGLIGPNGAGKSTLIKAMLGLVPFDSGSILINGKEIKDARKYIAYIPQKEEIDWDFPATVKDIVLMGRYPHKKKLESLNPEDYQICHEAMKSVGMDEYLDRQIGDLSGGQQQRIFIARALCQKAEIYFFDEPFVGVDILTEEKIIQIIKELASKGKTIIVIHHDLAKVKEYFNNLIMVNQRLVAFGKTSEVFTDENIKKTYGGRLTLLQKTDRYVYK